MQRNDNPAPSPSSPGRSPILVGRVPEQILLREELAAAMAGHGRLVLLGGEAGIGKTTLAQDLVQEARARDCLVLTGHCYDLTNTPPYGPWLELFATYPEDVRLPPQPTVFAGGVLDRISDQAALVTEIRQFVAGLAAIRPALILFEDLHWADPASLELLRHVARHISRWPVILVGTYRIDEPSHQQSFYRQLPALVREAAGFRINLLRLDARALRALVSASYSLAGPDLERLTGYLVQHSEGNPFFATELLRSVEDERLLTAASGEWELAELGRVVVPPFLRQVIEGRLERLEDRVRQPLAIAAVIGQEVPLALWAKIARLDDEELLLIVEQAVAAHILAAERDGAHVRFVHALTREALYESVLPPRRQQWHRQAAGALMEGARPDPDTVAYHLQQAGDPRAGEWLVKATDRAQRAYAWLTAADRLEAAAILLDDTPEQSHQRARLLHRLGKLRRFSDPATALARFDEAERLATHVGDALLAADIHYVRGVVLTYLDQIRAGLEAMIDAGELLAAMPLEVTRTLSPADPWIADSLTEHPPLDLSGEHEAAAVLHAAGLHFRMASHPMFLATAGHLDEAMSVANQFISALAGSPGAIGGIRSMRGFCYHGLGIAHAALGEPAEACQAWAHSRAFFSEYSHHGLITFTYLDELRDVAMTYYAHNPAVRRRLAAEAEAAFDRAGGAFHPGLSPRVTSLGCLILDGQWSEARAILDDHPDPHNAFLRRGVTAATVLLARYQGEPDVAWTRIYDRLPAGPATDPGDHIFQEALFLQRMAADLLLDAGDLAGAHAWLSAHDRWLAWTTGVLGRNDGALCWARYHWLAGDPTRARDLVSAVLTNTPAQPLARLAAHRLLGQIALATDDDASAETHLVAALALANACEAPYELAQTLLVVAEGRVAQGAANEASAALAEVRQICEPLGAVPVMARVEALEARLATGLADPIYPLGLTRREVEVLHLLAQRQTDKEIAARLFLAPRTVQSHVAHILNKLGVANRREAAAKAEHLSLW